MLYVSPKTSQLLIADPKYALLAHPAYALRHHVYIMILLLKLDIGAKSWQHFQTDEDNLLLIISEHNPQMWKMLGD